MLMEQKIFDSFITLLLNNENTIQFCYFFYNSFLIGSVL